MQENYTHKLKGSNGGVRKEIDRARRVNKHC